MNEDDRVRYAVAMKAYIRHLAESLRFWQQSNDNDSAHQAQQQLDEYLESFQRNEAGIIYYDMLRVVKEILREQ